MNPIKIAAIVLVVAGVVGLVCGGFSYTKETHEAKIGPLELSVKERETVNMPMAEALEIEARFFGEVTAGSTCRNLIRVFFLRETAKKRTLEGWFDDRSGSESRERAGTSHKAAQRHSPPPIRTVGIVGAGVMGSDIGKSQTPFRGA